MMARKEKNEYLIQSVSRACSLLEQFRGGVRELKVTELSRLLCVSKNNAFRLLATLEARNFIERNPATGAYRLGFSSLKVGEASLRSRLLERETRHSLEDISRQSGETAFLTVLGSEGLVCKDVVESTLPVRVVFQVGTCLPLHCTAAGKVMLACGSGEELGAFFGSGSLRKYSEQKTASTTASMKELRSIRERGYAISVGEFEAGASGVAAPVRNHVSKVIGVIGIVGPSFRLTHDRFNDEVAPLVVRAAREISLRMGYGELVRQKADSQGKHSYFDVYQGGALPGLTKEKFPTGDRWPIKGLFLQSERLNASSPQAKIAAVRECRTLSKCLE